MAVWGAPSDEGNQVLRVLGLSKQWLGKGL